MPDCPLRKRPDRVLCSEALEHLPFPLGEGEPGKINGGRAIDRGDPPRLRGRCWSGPTPQPGHAGNRIGGVERESCAVGSAHFAHPDSAAPITPRVRGCRHEPACAPGRLGDTFHDRDEQAGSPSVPTGSASAALGGPLPSGARQCGPHGSGRRPGHFSDKAHGASRIRVVTVDQ